MEDSLLNRVRLIKRKLQKLSWDSANETVIARGCSDALGCNTYLWAVNGRLINCFIRHDPCQVAKNQLSRSNCLPSQLNEYLLDLQEADYNQQPGKCPIKNESPECKCCERTYILIPMITGGKRTGTMVLTRNNLPFNSEDLMLAEFCAVLLSSWIGDRSRWVTNKKMAIETALDSLSFTERRAISYLLSQVDGGCGVCNISQLAEEHGLSRTSISTGIRKLVSAGLIEAHSLGVRGTYVRVLDKHIVKEIKKGGSFSFSEALPKIVGYQEPKLV